jgi:hypothetical protein
VNRPVLIPVVMLALGATGGWFARGVANGGRGATAAPAESEAAEPRIALPGDPAPPPPRSHDDELREILADPKAHALAGRVRNAARIDEGCEVELDTSVGWFRAACGPGETPSVGDKLELFGRVSPTGQIQGVPPLLRPSWLEQPGTIARLRGP